MGFGRWYDRQKVGVQVAVVGGVLTILAGVVAGGFGIVDVVLARPGAQPSSPSPVPALTASSSRSSPQDAPSRPTSAPASAVSHSPSDSTSAQSATIIYTMDPRRWQPAPVPKLMLAAGDTVGITAISGQWWCADVTGWTGIQGSSWYHPVNHAFAVPSAPFCSLIGKVDGGQWLALGNTAQFVADRPGQLELTTNELMPGHCPQAPGPTSCYTDNKGSITVRITVTPGH